VPPFLVDELAAYMATSPTTPTAPLFPAVGGGRLRVSNWKVRRFDPAAESVGLVPPSLRVHDLRHTAASLTIRSGVTLKAVQRQLGHKSATLTVDRHGHLFPDELDALAALEGLKAADNVPTIAGRGSAA
jgi:integrase